MKMGQEPSDKKTKLVLEICSLSASCVSCAHRPPHFASRPNSRFVDWYRLLGVEEKADLDVIRKRYHKLALLLHPDKNQHPKAELAFKLVLEAYSCLADIVKRRAFDSERCKNFCLACNKIPYTQWEPPRSTREPMIQIPRPSNGSRIRQSLKEMRDRFKEEVKVMEKCLGANPSKRRETPVANHKFRQETSTTNFTNFRTGRESPVFNPSDYKSDGYPHVRKQIFDRRPDSFRYLDGHGKGHLHYDSPVFGSRSAARMFKQETTSIHS